MRLFGIEIRPFLPLSVQNEDFCGHLQRKMNAKACAILTFIE